jgi:hypothetical protein
MARLAFVFLTATSLSNTVLVLVVMALLNISDLVDVKGKHVAVIAPASFFLTFVSTWGAYTFFMSSDNEKWLRRISGEEDGGNGMILSPANNLALSPQDDPLSAMAFSSLVSKIVSDASISNIPISSETLQQLSQIGSTLGVRDQENLIPFSSLQPPCGDEVNQHAAYSRTDPRNSLVDASPFAEAPPTDADADADVWGDATPPSSPMPISNVSPPQNKRGGGSARIPTYI